MIRSCANANRYISPHLFLSQPTPFIYSTINTTTNRCWIRLFHLVVQDRYSGWNVSKSMKVEQRLLELVLYNRDGRWGAGAGRRFVDLPTITKE